MSRRWRANMSWYSTRMFSMSSLSWLSNCESFHLKFSRNFCLSWGPDVGFSFWICSNSSISLRILLCTGVWVEGSPGLSGVGNQNCWDVSGFSVVFSSSFTYSSACSESSSVRTFNAAVDKGLMFFASLGVVMWNSATLCSS